MAEYISRDWLLTHTHTGMDTIQMMQTMIDAPAADVVEVRHGRWVHGREVGREYLGDCLVGIFYDRWTCSECGYVVDDHEYSGINYKFCPNCGAKMKGGVNE